MHKGRIEAFSDGVIAILITIMVLELHVPKNSDIESLRPLVPVFLSYVLSFVYLGIYWNNHHHLLQAAKHISGGVLWANLHLLFWLSLFPFVTGWMGENHFETVPVCIYGCVALLAAIAYYVLQRVLAVDVGRDLKGRLSPALYAIAIPLAFLNRWISVALYVTVALIWLVPDRRLERQFA
jgi:TMEM175 potassium channel family protein